jgi:translation elongation factor EF-4
MFTGSRAEGIQAQSISVYHVAKERGVHIIPVLNKAISIVLYIDYLD